MPPVVVAGVTANDIKAAIAAAKAYQTAMEKIGTRTKNEALQEVLCEIEHDTVVETIDQLEGLLDESD